MGQPPTPTPDPNPDPSPSPKPKPKPHQAGREQVWHLEVRWLICQGHRVEELIKLCLRRAKQAGRAYLLASLPSC